MFVEAAIKRQGEQVLAEVHMRAFATSVGFSGNQEALKKFDRQMRRELQVSSPASRLERGLREAVQLARARAQESRGRHDLGR